MATLAEILSWQLDQRALEEAGQLRLFPSTGQDRYRLTYQWGKRIAVEDCAGVSSGVMDCLGYASWLRGRAGYGEIDLDLPAFREFYEQYPTEDDMPPLAPIELARRVAVPRAGVPQSGDFVLLRLGPVQGGNRALVTSVLIDGVCHAIARSGPAINIPLTRMRGSFIAGVFDVQGIAKR